jgi:hypothetical protein
LEGERGGKGGRKYVSDIELEIRADDGKRQRWEDESPVGVAVAVESGEEEANGVGEGADAHEEFVGEFVED